jgi:putative aldouronate transport system permease protein
MKKNWELYLMILPTAILFAIFIYIPYAGLILAFRDYDIVGGLLGHQWAGFKYFLQFFQDPYFFRILRNTVLLNLFMLLIAFPAPIAFALLVNEIQQSKIKRLVQSVSYLPHFLSTVIVVGIMIETLSSKGIINQAITALGLPVQLFFNEPGWFRPLYIGSSTWEGLGWGAIIYFAALAGINPELYEYASIEGAGRFAMVRFITIPCLLPTIVILFILAVGQIMNVGFEKVFLMYNPGTYETADVISTYVYRRGILGMDYSYATAVGLFNSVVNFGMLVGANSAVKRVGYSLW